MANKLWQKDFSLNEQVEKFTVGQDRELDLWLAEYDVLGSMAHATMLKEINILTEEELQQLLGGLKDIHKEISAGDFIIEEGVEDVHSQIEFILTEKLGNVGKKIHTGRSRNDQVLVDLKMYFRQAIWETAEKVKALFDVLIERSEELKDVLMPGYTHMQVAMPSSFGLWLGAYAESLTDDMEVLKAAFKVANKNPLGSAAGYGSSFPIKRQLTTDLLGFQELNYNVVYAQMGRGKTEYIISNALATTATTLTKMAMDICLYMGQNFGFFKLPNELTTGSSIMPHKKNPDVFELIRARTNRLVALPTQVAMIIQNLPAGYHRDFQLIKEEVLPAFEELHSCLDLATFAISKMEVSEELIKQDKYKYLFTVEKVNKLVVAGVPFRDAYKEVGESVENGTFEAEYDIDHTHEGSIGNLCNAEISQRINTTMEGFGYNKVRNQLDQLLG